MYKYLFLFALTISFAILSNAQTNSKTTEDSIKLTINTFFKGMQSKDTSLIRTTLTDKIIMQTIQKNRKGETAITTEPVEFFFYYYNDATSKY